MAIKKTDEVLLCFDGTEVPFVIKREDKYYINNSIATNRIFRDNSLTEYTDDVDLLLNAIKQAKSIDYHSIFGKADTKAEYWQLYFNYMFSGKGGLVLWHNPTESWESELARRGELICKNCGGKMVMYYTPQCFKCEKPKPDKKGRYMLIPVCYYIALKQGLPLREIWEYISRKTDFIDGNDRACDLYKTGNKDTDKYINMIDEEFPVETTNFYVSW